LRYNGDNKNSLESLSLFYLNLISILLVRLGRISIYLFDKNNKILFQKNFMFKKTLIISIISIFFLTTGFGCKGLSTTQQASLKPIKLIYWTIYDDVDELRVLATEYSQRYPNVTIDIRQVNYNEFDNLFTNALADDVGPDIVSQHATWLRKNQTRLLPAPAGTQMSRMVIADNFSKDQQIVTDTNLLPTINSISKDYVKTVANDVILDNKIYGLPLSLDTLAIFYNQDLLDRAGIAEAPKDWATFISDVKKLTKFNSVGDIVQAGTALGTYNNINAAFDITSLFIINSFQLMFKASGGPQLRKAPLFTLCRRIG